ncbi:type II secretion system F family protein [Diaphorobacter ruginosibacter]|uniref:type II secretion system F family protein n=1 Tax=Diaphorobacter ruginosibacter TaxID=1715720 RepID=UPI00334219A3
MPDFEWSAAAANGKVTKGSTNAASSAQVLKRLREQGLTPLDVREASTAGAASSGAKAAKGALRGGRKKGVNKGKVTSADVLSLTSELAIMLKAGLALDNALRVLIDMSYKPSVTALLADILEKVKSGTPLSKALSNHPQLFNDFYVNMIRSGEISGQMSSVLARLVEHMERVRSLRESVISAAIYPAILLSVAVLSLVAMLGFVVPQFEKLFNDMGDALPAPTRVVMNIGKMFQHYGWLIVIAAAVVIWLIIKWFKTPVGRQWWQSVVLRLPLIGTLSAKYEMTLFSRSLGTLLGNGVPLLTALHISTQTVTNILLRKPLETMAPKVKEGGKVADAAIGTGVFEPLAINLIRVGEETGRIGPMTLELANILNREVEVGIKRTLTLVEPVLILVLGILIASIIVSILLGILSVNDLAT